MKIALGTASDGKTKSEQCVKVGMEAKIKMRQSNGYRN